LSSFQRQTEAALVSALAAAGCGLTARRLEGVEETFIRAEVQGTGAEVFIYNDEAGLRGPDVDKRFEAPDYRDGGTLARAFVQETVDYAKRYGREQPGR
jgi:hypothetical protein